MRELVPDNVRNEFKHPNGSVHLPAHDTECASWADSYGRVEDEEQTHHGRDCRLWLLDRGRDQRNADHVLDYLVNPERSAGSFGLDNQQ